MKSNASKCAVVWAVGCGLLLWAGTAAAGEARHSKAGFAPTAGQEVVNGSYRCTGTVYTDEQPANVGAGAYLSATSGITPSGFFGTSRESREVPADLDAMAVICDAHIEQVLAQIPRICAIGPVRRDRGEFGNGASVGANFDFSCQGTRDEVIGVIGLFSRLSLTQPLP